MSYLFVYSKFDGDISNWNTSSVTKMDYLFYNSELNRDISSWRPLKLEKTESMFLNCSAPIPYWFGNNNEEIVKNIESYDLFNKMNSSLSSKKTKTKIMKI